MTFLEIYDMFFRIVDLFVNTKLNKFHQCVINLSPPAAYEQISLEIKWTLSNEVAAGYFRDWQSD